MSVPPTSRRPLRLGTRGSTLARLQSELVAASLRRAGHDVELVTIVTAGDVRPPDTAWGEGAFVGALEAALAAGEVDLAVHSAKDVPIDDDPATGLVIAAYPGREDPRDALVLRVEDGRDVGLPGAGSPDVPLGALPRSSRVGTDSPRRAGFLSAARPDLSIVPLHGNVDTRLRRLDAGDVDALVLAVAGLARLGRADRVSAAIDPAVLPPAPGQGALAVQCRAGDHQVLDALHQLDDGPTRLAVEAEREILRATGGGCRAPLGATATNEGDRLDLLAGALTLSGRAAFLRRSGPAVRWRDLAASAADELLRAGFRGEAA